MTSRISGVLLAPADVDYLARALELLVELLTQRGSRPVDKLVAMAESLRTDAESDVLRLKTGVGVRVFGREQDSCHAAWHAVVDTTEAAGILGISAGGVRDLARRGSIPARRAGGRWILDAASVVRRAERGR